MTSEQKNSVHEALKWIAERDELSVSTDYKDGTIVLLVKE